MVRVPVEAAHGSLHSGARGYGHAQFLFVGSRVGSDQQQAVISPQDGVLWCDDSTNRIPLTMVLLVKTSNNGSNPTNGVAVPASSEPAPGTAETLVVDDPRTVRMGTLVSLIVGSCVGAGIFALPQNVASVASPGAAMIGWAITGVGMLCIAFVFQALATRKPHLDSGVYSYVRWPGRFHRLRLRLGLLAGHDHRTGGICHAVLQLVGILSSHL